MNIDKIEFIAPKHERHVMQATLNTQLTLFLNKNFERHSGIKKGVFVRAGTMPNEPNTIYLTTIDANKDNSFEASGVTSVYIPFKTFCRSLGILPKKPIKYQVQCVKTGVYKLTTTEL